KKVNKMNIDPSTTKYLVKARLIADGIVEKPDVVGAIFGQTEGLLGDELDLRDLQKSGRIGRIEVEVGSKQGKSEGEVLIPSSLDQVETVILASALETIDRVGPCKAKINIESIEDVRITKRARIIDRARELLGDLMKQSKNTGIDLTESVRQSVQVEEVIHYGKDRLPAGPNVPDSDSIIIVEGRSDVLNLLKSGIKNAIAVEGTNIPKTISDLSRERIVTAFVDGDRGGELILRELFQVAEVDFVTRAPRGQEVEELTQKQIMKCLRNKIPGEQFVEMYGFGGEAAQANNVVAHTAEKTERMERMETAIAPREEREERRPVKKLSPAQQKYKTMLSELSSTLNGRLLNDKGVVIKEVPSKELANVLKDAPKETVAVVFDGVITQRILDLATERKIGTVVGTKISNVTKQPSSVEIWTKDDLN
ncbi:MAG: DNA primase, partial [Methanomassiliicoccales archaeon]|nr:DNA primase [Methanomassiliicoccales archaeon]